MRRIVVLLFLLWAAPVQAQLTQAQVQTTIATDVLSCGNGCVTAEVLRFVLGQMNQATFQFTQFPNTFGPPQSFIGSNVAAITADGAQAVFQNSSTTAENILSGNTGGFVYDVARCALFIPSGNTSNNAECYGAYVRNRSVSSSIGNGVLYYGLITCGVSSSACFGSNYRLADSETVTGSGLTGIRLAGSEFDIAVYNAGTTAQGASINLTASTVQPTFAAGWDCTGNSTARFTFCYVSEDNSAVTALYAGTAAGAGASVAGQKIGFAYYDSGSTERFPTLNPTPAGALLWTGPGLTVSPTAGNSPGGVGGASTITIQALAGQQGALSFTQGATALWQMGGLGNGHFFAFDNVGGAFVWQMTTGGTFAFTPGISAPSYTVGATAGSSCTLTTVSHLTVVNGIVTLCN